MDLDLKTEHLMRDICAMGPVEYADMLDIIERYQPPIAPLDFAVYVQNARRRCGSNEKAAMLAIQQLQAEEDRRRDIVEAFRGRPDEQQIREALGVK